MKVLVVILNKNNAESLRRCLNSLIKQRCKICQEFDVLVMDGGSSDDSREVTLKFSRDYPCIKFKVQEIIGGTGFARREACIYALERGYDVVIWGDSENEYDESYIEEVLKKLKKCDVVGGIPEVNGDFFGHAFAWYHAIHLIIPKLYRVHIPGNNRAEKTFIYRKVIYPTSIRAEDYGFSILLLKKGIRLEQCVANALVRVSLPRTLRDVLSWQEIRARGVAQTLKEIEFGPWDLLAWSSILALLIIFLVISLISPLPLAIYMSILILISIYLYIRSIQFIKKPKIIYALAPLIGIMIYSFYSIKALIYYLR